MYTSACDSGSGGAAKGAAPGKGTAPAKAARPLKPASPPKTEDKPMEMAGMDMRSVETGESVEVAGFDLKSICDGPEPPEKVSITLGYSFVPRSFLTDYASTGLQGHCK